MSAALERVALWLDDEPRDAAWNMALDEALLLVAAEPVLRFYRWRARAVTFGYAQEHAPVARRYAGWDMTRRWTGGGSVEHGEDVTYALVLPSGRGAGIWAGVRESYLGIHRALVAALRAGGVPATLSGGVVAPGVGGACFVAPICHDVVLGEAKIAGGAQRRCRRGLLHQGSVQGVEVGRTFRETFAACLADRVTGHVVEPALWESATRLAAERYGAAAWVERR